MVLVARVKKRTSRDAIARLRFVIESAGGNPLGVVATGARSGGLYAAPGYGYESAYASMNGQNKEQGAGARSSGVGALRTMPTAPASAKLSESLGKDVISSAVSSPIVSVVIPTHNRADLLGGAIEFVLRQHGGPPAAASRPPRGWPHAQRTISPERASVCGIAGYVQQARVSDADLDVLRRQLAVLRHRGPDSEGVVGIGPAALGQTRLAIIDLVTGDPPITNEDGAVAVAFNGEIYNFRALRALLKRLGHEFTTRGTPR